MEAMRVASHDAAKAQVRRPRGLPLQELEERLGLRARGVGPQTEAGGLGRPAAGAGSGENARP